MRKSVAFAFVAACHHASPTSAPPPPPAPYRATIDGHTHELPFARALRQYDQLRVLLADQPIGCDLAFEDDPAGTWVELKVPLGFGDYYVGHPVEVHVETHGLGTKAVVTLERSGSSFSGTIAGWPGFEGSFRAEACPGDPGEPLPSFHDQPLSLTIDGAPVAVSQVVVWPSRATFVQLGLFSDGRVASCAERNQALPKRTIQINTDDGHPGTWQPGGIWYAVGDGLAASNHANTAAVRFDTESSGALVLSDEDRPEHMPPIRANGRWQATVCPKE